MRIGVSASTHLHYLLIGLGVAFEITCAAPILFIGEGRLGLTLLFILISLGIVLIVTGAMVPRNSFDDGDDNGDNEEDDDTPPLLKPIKHLITFLYMKKEPLGTPFFAYYFLSFFLGVQPPHFPPQPLQPVQEPPRFFVLTKYRTIAPTIAASINMIITFSISY